MLIVADSGSTKTDWRLFDKRHGVQELQTIGLNPYFLTGSEISSVLEKELHPILNKAEVSEVYFYGSGCSHADKIMEIENALSDFFSNANIIVESDLLGTAKALCGNKLGIVAILGTGSNSCVYDGEKITDQLLSLGYVLGDEGSGAVLGKKVLKAALSGNMPESLLKDFQEAFSIRPDVVLQKIYRKPFPNRYLASFAPFATKHMADAWMNALLKEHLVDFFKEMVMIYDGYKEYNLNLTGSLAWHLLPLIEELCKKYEIQLGKVLKQPIDDLLNYHLSLYQAGK
ncbi:MAG: ATPase [Bacteroidales bacterium]|nr:ATPase [Bacteroidales bacterium]